MTPEQQKNWPEFFHSEKERDDRAVVLKLERAEFRRRTNRALENTNAFVDGHESLGENGAPLSEDDVLKIHVMLRQIAPMTEQNKGLYEHLITSSLLARKIADALRRKGDEDIDPIRVEIRTLLDDLGRLMGQQRYVRNDLEGRALGKRIGLRDDFFDHRSAHDIVDPQAFIFEELSTEDRIVIIADLVGKREKDGRVRTFDQALTYHKQSRHDADAYKKRVGGTNPVFPSELGGLRDMAVDQKHFTNLYIAIDKWLTNRGIDINKIAEEI